MIRQGCWIGFAVLALLFGWLCLGDAQPAEPEVQWETRSFKVIAYCPCVKCCGKFADGYTASGVPVSYNGGKIVAAHKSLPFGTRVIIPGYGEAEVQDRGRLDADHLDVLFPTHQEALEWGVRRLVVQIAFAD